MPDFVLDTERKINDAARDIDEALIATRRGIFVDTMDFTPLMNGTRETIANAPKAYAGHLSRLLEDLQVRLDELQIAMRDQFADLLDRVEVLHPRRHAGF